MSDTPLHPLTSQSDWTDALEKSSDGPVLIFKHSTACSVSAKAHPEMAEVGKTEDIPTYKVVVQEARPVSDAIEADLEIRHETPQVLLVEEGQVMFNASHFDVTAEAIRDELRRTQTSVQQ